MRLLVYLIFAVPFMFGQIAVASPREDAEYIAERTVLEGDRVVLLQMLASRYVNFLEEELGKHSVHVVDANRFEEMLPVGVVEPWLKRWQEIYVERLLESQSPARLIRIANGARTLAEKSENSQASDSDETAFSMTGALGFLFASQVAVIEEIKQSIPPLKEAPYLADILETDGIFSFPNPIWRRDLIARIRSGV